MNTLIAEDFSAIHARLLAIRDAERSWMVPPPEPSRPEPGQPGESPADFYSWLVSGRPWGGG